MMQSKFSTMESAATSSSGESSRMNKPASKKNKKIDPAICTKAARYAVRVYGEMSKRSVLLKEDGLDETVAVFEKDEIIPYLGDLLGKGGFNNVYELEKVVLTKNYDRTRNLRSHIVLSKPKLAVKFLSDDAMSSSEDACNGSADLLMEAKYLTALAAHPHPGIIKLHGISSAGPPGFGKPERAGFFLIIDRLYDTLDKRMEVWRELQRRKMSSKSKSNKKQQQQAHDDGPDDDEAAATRKYLQVLFVQRMLAALDIVSAVQHLHSLNIVFRDLKPDNVGFDYEGKVKIFDFGLAKELDPAQKTDDEGLYSMSGGTGSRRFMAPEVALSESYGLSADLYSYSILLWEMLTLEKAFGKLSVDEHKARAILGTYRPGTPGDWSASLQDIFEGCWSPDPFRRPTARDVYKMLKQEIQDVVARDFPNQRSRAG